MNTATHANRLRHFPITFLAIPLGFAGFTLALQKGGALLALPKGVSTAHLWVTIGLFAITLFGYLLKATRYPKEVAADFNHPIKVNFFPLVAKVLLVLSVIFLSRNMVASKYLWFAGTALQLLASLAIVTQWVNQNHFHLDHLTPAWFIPIVGNLIVPIAGVEHGYVEISWFFFSIGLVFWLALFTVVLNRMIFHHPIMEKLMPTMFILFAPPAIAFIAYYKLTGEIDAFARILYYIATFLFMLILLQVKQLLKIRYFLSWWAYSFPLAAKALSSILMFHLTHSMFAKVLAQIEIILLVGIIGVLVVRTVRAISRKEVCVQD
ncbi:MAG: SLAC1 anion channel family protein [Deltaproteobacteria bacterium]|nr:SLAC1 anion channel family protein [Deltaproteobacteria bacterium]MBN2671092.1 SLAC1 anion channel family protein [Deltaproteobacteria bacterium]